jgi:hypothetical protein
MVGRLEGAQQRRNEHIIDILLVVVGLLAETLTAARERIPIQHQLGSAGNP